MTDENTTCPYCKESIKADAIKCKHCHSNLADNLPEHEGVCPFCKEEVNTEAIKCKHCGSKIGGTVDATSSPCGCSSSDQVFTEIAMRSPTRFGDDQFGQECFYRCRAAPGRDGKGHSHATCERRCQISMPSVFRNADFFFGG
ncbi:MAG: hypothetical protein GQ529_08205 [Methyloprofundus sp.]|nr:hypothetical protein [Methyloprofundus sp.]